MTHGFFLLLAVSLCVHSCYLNSTVQQLFMIPTVRRNLLSARASAHDATPPSQSTLFQLQTIMAFLQGSEKQSYDPQGLCKTFTDPDGNPLNVGVQEDAAGFVTRLIDKIVETVDKGSEEGAALKTALYGQTADVFQGHPPRCAHTKERLEEFAVIGLGVRNCKTLQDSLRAFVAGEVMEGSNAYKCTQCDAKVTPHPRRQERGRVSVPIDC
jgi:ubiquitin carboxyl-terminal hydrolase 34